MMALQAAENIMWPLNSHILEYIRNKLLFANSTLRFCKEWQLPILREKRKLWSLQKSEDI